VEAAAGCQTLDIAATEVTVNNLRPEESRSALKGVAWVNDEVFVTAGYDQRLALWRWTDDGAISLVSETPIGVVMSTVLRATAVKTAKRSLKIVKARHSVEKSKLFCIGL